MIRGVAVLVQKVILLPPKISFIFSTPPTASVSTTIIMAWGTTAVFPVVPGRKTENQLSLYRLGGGAYTCHGHSRAFPCQRWLDFSHR